MATNIKSLIKCRNLVIGCTNKCPYCYARNNCRRYHMTEDFSIPEFFPAKLRLLDIKKPANWLLTCMSDLADWKREWVRETLSHISYNPQCNFLFLTKSPERIDFQTDLNNVWAGVTITCSAEKNRIEDLKKHVLCKHYYITFEPLHSPVGTLDLSGIEWIVIGTETGKRKGKISARIEWIMEIVKQAEEKGIPVFMKEELEAVIGTKNMIQKLPEEFIVDEV